MADNKKSVVIYVDWGSTFDNLDEVESGRLIKHFFNYVRDLNPEPPDRLTQIAFEPIKQQLKRDLNKWENIKEKRSIAGKNGGLRSVEASKTKQNQANQPIASFVKQNQANQAVNDNVTVTVNDTVNVINKEGTIQNPLQNSNLFRKPKVPPLNDVKLFFYQNGGTDEMAKKFFDKWEGVGWYYNNSPIVNYSSFAENFILNYKKFEHGKTNSRIIRADPSLEDYRL